MRGDPPIVLLLLLLWKSPYKAFPQQEDQSRQSRRRRRHDGGGRHSSKKETRNRHHRRQSQQQQDSSKGNWEDESGKEDEVYPVIQGRPSNIVEAASGSLVVGGIAAAASTGALIGIPVWTWHQITRQSNETTVQYWNRKSRSFVKSVLAGCVTSSLVVIVATTVAVSKLIVGLWNTPKIVWQAGLQGKKYWNSTSASWERYNLEKHARELEEILNAGSFSVRDETLYKLLCVKPFASAKEIKRAFYKLAKEHHPDKNSDPQSHAKFVELHKAYETLYDTEKRRHYDEFGVATTASKDKTAVFDLGINMDIFFEVLLGFSPKVEYYVGDLSIASFSRVVMEAVQVVTTCSTASRSEQDELFRRFMARAFFDGEGRSIPQMKTEQRQVEIALYLKSFVSRYIALASEGTQIADSVFRGVCEQEAMEVVESSAFAPFFLQSIGKGLYWECGRGNHWDVLGLTRTAQRSRGRARYWSTLMRKSLRVYQNFQRQYQLEVEKMGLGTSDRSGKDSDLGDDANETMFRQAEQQAFRSVLSFPSIMDDFVWPTIDMDISNTIQGACWKVLNEDRNDDDAMTTRRRQVRAFRILGQEFIRVGTSFNLGDDGHRHSHPKFQQKDKDCSSCDSPSRDSDDVNLQHRIQVALFMARMNQGQQRNFHRESEELIREFSKQRASF
ncbi:DnaJ protein [Nitzschia inconspicua]|uniref:DnaJ protein n=1 Tax=Nitzschia inconspicua TaxID=303405 RepID=A0A9K3KVP3_9STRA|nr:DnaJ protein [Nitzschia inconspicua]